MRGDVFQDLGYPIKSEKNLRERFQFQFNSVLSLKLFSLTLNVRRRRAEAVFVYVWKKNSWSAKVIIFRSVPKSSAFGGGVVLDAGSEDFSSIIHDLQFSADLLSDDDEDIEDQVKISRVVINQIIIC